MLVPHSDDGSCPPGSVADGLSATKPLVCFQGRGPPFWLMWCRWLLSWAPGETYDPVNTRLFVFKRDLMYGFFKDP